MVKEEHSLAPSRNRTFFGGSRTVIRSNVWSREITKDGRWKIFFTSSPFLLVVGIIALLLGGVVIARLMGEMSETFDLYTQRIASVPLILYAWGFVICAMIVAVMIILRQKELLATVVIATNIYVDWYLGLAVVSQIMAVVLLLIFFLARSPQFPWASPRALWLWAVFLVLSIFPAARALNFSDGAYYYLTIIFSAFVMFWLGTAIARNSESVRRFLMFLSILGAFIAIHTIIEAVTGVFLFKTPYYDTQLASVSYFQLSPGYFRAESFFKNPDSAGGFFAIMLLIPLGLFAGSSLLRKKVFYLAEMGLVLLALLFTYSTGGWVAALVGVGAFVVLVRRTLYRILIPLLIFTTAVVIIFFFPSQVALQIQHATDPQGLLLRTAVWRTAINVIKAFPLSGIGMGRNVYLVRSDPYRVFEQYVAAVHPHNSYLEFAALGGIPVLLVFIALLSYALWQALHNWRLSDVQTRSLFAGGIAAVIALSCYSFSNAGWTLVPLAALGWLILGVTSSPLLSKNRSDETMHKNSQAPIP